MGIFQVLALSVIGSEHDWTEQLPCRAQHVSLAVLGIFRLLPWETSSDRSELQRVAEEQNAAASEGHSQGLLQFSENTMHLKLKE